MAVKAETVASFGALQPPVSPSDQRVQLVLRRFTVEAALVAARDRLSGESGQGQAPEHSFSVALADKLYTEFATERR